MRKLFITTLFFVCCYVAGAQTNTLAQKIAALSGSYRHSPPCTDCTGIQTTLTLDCDAPCNSGIYTFTEDALNTINGDKENGSNGKWRVSDTVASPHGPTLIIALTDTTSDDRYKNYFILKDGNLEQLDKNKQPIDPPFNILLVKLPNGTILDLR